MFSIYEKQEQKAEGRQTSPSFDINLHIYHLREKESSAENVQGYKVHWSLIHLLVNIVGESIAEVLFSRA